MRVLFAGTPQAALPALDAVAASRHEIVAVLTRPDAPAGRGRRLAAAPVSVRAAELGLRVLTPARPREPDFLGELADLAPDACPIVAYGSLIPAAALAVPPLGWVNLHFSLLPAWRGAAPVQHAVMAGDDLTGATTFRLERGLDTGPTYGVTTERIGAHDTAGEVLARLAQSGARLLVATMDALEDGTISAIPQPAEGVSLAPKVEVADARIRWGAPAVAVDRQIRGCTPAPGAWTRFRGERLRVLAAMPAPPSPPSRNQPAAPAPGQIRAGREVEVGTGSQPVRLLQVQPNGRRPIPAPDWARGARLTPGERLGDG